MKNRKTIADQLAVHATVRADTTAFVMLDNGTDVEKAITYKDLHRSVQTLAAQLTQHSLAAQRALLVYQDVSQFVIAFLACQCAGIIPVPVPFIKGSKQVARLLGIMSDAEAEVIFCADESVIPLQQAFAGLPGSEKLRILATDNILTSEVVSGSRSQPNEIAFIQYTSGSTGKPKGVVVSMANLLHNQQLIAKTFGCDENSVIFSWLPFHHDMGLIGNLLHTIYTGCTCILMHPLQFIQKPERWLECISQYRVTHSGGPNFAYDLCVERISSEHVASLDLSSWKVAYNGSELVRASTIQSFSDHFKAAGFRQEAFHPCYGLAEATLLVSGQKKRDAVTTLYADRDLDAEGKVVLTEKSYPHAKAVVGSGAVAHGMQVAIISVFDQHKCEELEEGEICISGKSVTSGYWNSNDNDLFHLYKGKSYLRTGDLGFLYKGELFVSGRLKEMLIVRGRNVYAYDMEAAVASCSKAIESNGVAVFALNKESEEFVVVAEIKRSLIKEIDAEKLIDAIDKKIIGSFGASAYDIILTTPLGIPRTTSGKLQRVKCREVYAQGGFNVIESRQGLQKIPGKQRNMLLLQDVILHADTISVRKYLIDLIQSKVGNIRHDVLNDDVVLTELGVDSLRAMELMNIINRDLGISLDAASIFQAGTLAGFVRAIENMLWVKNKQPFGKEITI